MRLYSTTVYLINIAKVVVFVFVWVGERERGETGEPQKCQASDILTRLFSFSFCTLRKRTHSSFEREFREMAQILGLSLHLANLQLPAGEQIY